MQIDKYVGRNVEIIYQDSKGQITKRRVAVYSVRDGLVHVKDLTKKSIRTFVAERILAVMPAHSGRVS
ncbi:hypothetical protein [Cohnella nanjingensis]|uniref:WYL domain-containing protein n=1 Tax=Cohnella nanjingensis TaxID=1387779 RepID=A0A7X0VE33_9BACL|nr:hypothetical protein [Cohnella nanjingensis]MBB6670301.1 hypothetical protein [Cohnella nanjingensis]